MERAAVCPISDDKRKSFHILQPIYWTIFYLLTYCAKHMEIKFRDWQTQLSIYHDIKDETWKALYVFISGLMLCIFEHSAHFDNERFGLLRVLLRNVNIERAPLPLSRTFQHISRPLFKQKYSVIITLDYQNLAIVTGIHLDW